MSDETAAEIPLAEFHALWAGGDVTLLDVRNADEYAEKHVPGAVLIPLPELGARLDEVPAGSPLYVICASGKRSMVAATALVQQAGIEAVNVAGGTNGWAAAGYPIEA